MDKTIILQEIKVLLPTGKEVIFNNFAEWKAFTMKLKNKDK